MLAFSDRISSWTRLKLINSSVLTSLLLPHLSSSLTDSLPSFNLLCHSKTYARFMQNGRKAVWSIPHVSVAFFPSLKQNFIAYRSSKVSDCIFEIHQLWQSGFSRVYSNCCCRCSFEPVIIKIGQSSHKTYSNKILNFPESTTILDTWTKIKSGNLLNAPRIYLSIYPIYQLIFIHKCATNFFICVWLQKRTILKKIKLVIKLMIIYYAVSLFYRSYNKLAIHNSKVGT